MKTKVLIVGGGIAGLALALKLGQSGLGCAVIDPKAPDSYDFKKHGGRTAALMGQSVDLLSALGVWKEIEEQTAPLEIMKIIDDGNPSIDPVEICFPAREINEENFGRNVPNCYLREVLYEHVKRCTAVACFIPNSLEKLEITSSGAIAILDDGQKIEADVIVGADGRFSKVRNIAKIEHKEIDYDQGAITCLISHTKSHENISTEHHRAGGPFTTVPMPDKDSKHYSSVVWVEQSDEAQKYIALSKKIMEQALKDKTRHALGDITLESAPENWPLKAIIAQDLIAPRIALIAEAAHAMSPIGAQGLNLSLRDVDILADIIINGAMVGEDIGSEINLEKYQSARSLDLQTRFYGVDQYNKIVSNNIGFIRGLRRGGLKTLAAIPALKKIAMQVGLKPAA